MLLKKEIEIKINSNNIKFYKQIFNIEINKNDILKVCQTDISPKSHMLLECECENCKIVFSRKRKDIKEKTFCSRKCQLNYSNPNPKKEKIKVECENCNCLFEVFESKFKKQKIFHCSRECYSEYRSKNYNMEKIYSYQNINTPCTNCKKEIKTSKWYQENKNNQFCSQECYWIHRKENYKEFYYNTSLNDSRQETSPERKVREYLEQNNIKFIQEKELFGYYIDFYLIDYKIALEVYGDYWHCNPDVYGENKKTPNKNQIRALKKDKIRNKKISYGVKEVVIIWEKQINENLNKAMEELVLSKCQ